MYGISISKLYYKWIIFIFLPEVSWPFRAQCPLFKKTYEPPCQCVFTPVFCWLIHGCLISDPLMPAGPTLFVEFGAGVGAFARVVLQAFPRAAGIGLTLGSREVRNDEAS